MSAPSEQPVLSIEEHVEQVWSRMRENSPIYKFVLSSVKFTSVAKGHVLATLLVEPQHVNSKGSLHGSVSTCIVDWMGSMVVASHRNEKTGVSTDIHTTFVGGAVVGDELTIEGRSERVGRSMAFVTVGITRVNGGQSQVVVKGSHTKFLTSV